MYKHFKSSALPSLICNSRLVSFVKNKVHISSQVLLHDLIQCFVCQSYILSFCSYFQPLLMDLGSSQNIELGFLYYVLNKEKAS